MDRARVLLDQERRAELRSPSRLDEIHAAGDGPSEGALTVAQDREVGAVAPDVDHEHRGLRDRLSKERSEAVERRGAYRELTWIDTGRVQHAQTRRNVRPRRGSRHQLNRRLVPPDDLVVDDRVVDVEGQHRFELTWQDLRDLLFDACREVDEPQ